MCVLPCFLCWLCLQPPLCCFLVDCCGEMCWTKIRIWRVDLVRRLPSVGSSTLKCLETLCPPLVMNFCRVQGATVGTQQVFRVRKMRTALWLGLRTEHCRKPVLALPHSSGWSGGQDAAPALSLLGSLLKMWHMCSLRQESQSLLAARACQGPEVTTKMSLSVLEQDEAGAAYEELAVSVLRPWLQPIRATSIRKK